MEAGYKPEWKQDGRRNESRKALEWKRERKQDGSQNASRMEARRHAPE